MISSSFIVIVIFVIMLSLWYMSFINVLRWQLYYLEQHNWKRTRKKWYVHFDMYIFGYWRKMVPWCFDIAPYMDSRFIWWICSSPSGICVPSSTWDSRDILWEKLLLGTCFHNDASVISHRYKQATNNLHKEVPGE